MTSVVSGYDSSLLNGMSAQHFFCKAQISQGLQILPQWDTYFGLPRGKVLGKLIVTRKVEN